MKLRTSDRRELNEISTLFSNNDDLGVSRLVLSANRELKCRLNAIYAVQRHAGVSDGVTGEILENLPGNKKRRIASPSPCKHRGSTSHNSASKAEWLTTRPIYVANGLSIAAGVVPSFPPRRRKLFCYICGEEGNEAKGELLECSTTHCHVKFHLACAKQHTGGGYTFVFMERNKGLHCPRHHCASCFADHNRVRCFSGKLVCCSQCELAWHADGCVPGGCTSDEKSGEILCPRHIEFPNPPHMHTKHCCDCQQRPIEGEQLLHCTTCLRSFHTTCFKERRTESPSAAEKAKGGEVDRAVCNWCRSYDFVRYEQYCMGRMGGLKWYPCQVVRNEDYPNQADQLLGCVGYMAVRWLPYRGKLLFNVISHNRVVPMSERDFFYVTEAAKSKIFEEWKEAQQHAAANAPENNVPRAGHISFLYSNNGEKIKKIAKNRYTAPETRPAKEQLEAASLCHCLTLATGERCGPTSECINRTLGLECPEECESRGKCRNRPISSGENCVPLSIISGNGRYFGAVTMIDIPKNGFVGEYVGEVITHHERERRIERISQFQSLEAQYYIIDLDNHRAIDAEFYGNDMRYVNHSCHPNTKVEVVTTASDIHMALFALRDIKRGEELSFDYNMYSNSSARAVPRCRCLATNCTGVLAAKPLKPAAKGVDTVKQANLKLKKKKKLPPSSLTKGESSDYITKVPKNTKKIPFANLQPTS